MSTPFPDLSRWMRGAGSAHVTGISVFHRSVEMHFADSSLAGHVMPAFRHIEKPGRGDLDLLVRISDESTHPGFLDETPWKTQIEESGDRILMANSGSLHMQYNPDSAVFSLIDTERGEAWYHARSLPDIPWYEKSAPMRMIMHWMCETHGMTLVHAGAVSCGSSCILLTGKGGSGKSTTAVSCALSGMRYLGDDYIVLMKNGTTHAASLYCSAKVGKDMLGRLPEISVAIPGADGEKAVLFLEAACTADASVPMPVSAILAPKVSDSGPRVRRIPGVMAFAEISSSTIFQMPGSGKSTFEALRELFRDIPVHALDLSPVLEDNVREIRMFCSGGACDG